MASQIDLFTGEYRKRQGLAAIEDHGPDFLTEIRGVARNMATLYGKVSVDELRRYALAENLEPHHQNAWGAVFRGSEWVCIGWKKSTFTTNHARAVRVWKLK